MNKARDHNRLSPACIVMVGLYVTHFAICCAYKFGLRLTPAEQLAEVISVLGPMSVAWFISVIEVFHAHR